MLGALTRPTDGKVLLDGTDIWALSEAELARFRSRHIGFIFQFPSLLSNLTAVDNVAVPALLGRTMDGGGGLRAGARSPRPCRTGGPRRRLSGQHVGRRAAPRRGRPRADQFAARCCWPTSRPATSTRTPKPTSSTCSSSCSGPKSFGLALVTHNLELARRAQRTYEMRQGALAPKTDAAGDQRSRRSASRGTSGPPRFASVRRRRRRPRHARRSVWAAICCPACRPFW